MFVGSVPTEVVSQALATVPFDQWGRVYVGCSGSFKLDRAIKMRSPQLQVFGNDASLLSCAIGALAMRREFDIRFKGALEFVEPLVAGTSFKHRVAAVMVACAMGRYTGKNDFARAHLAHYQANFAEFTADAVPRLEGLLKEVLLEEFYPGDFKEQIDRAAQEGGGFVAFPPTYKGGYEKLYRLVNENTDWTPPAYGLWDPKQLPALVDELDERGVPYCIISDQLIAGREPRSEYRGSNKPVYTYSRTRSASVLRRAPKAKPFAYTPIDAAKLGPDSKVDVRIAESGHLTFLKNVYLAKGIHHVTGAINFLVFVDDMLAGGIVFTQTKFGERTRELYMLSDFSTTRERKVSKLIAMIATSRDLARVADRKLVAQIEEIHTTAFTTAKVSMKYRGIYEMTKRAEDHLQYMARVRDQTPQELYREWLEKFGGDEDQPQPRAGGSRGAGRTRNPRRAAQAQGAQAA